MPWHGRLGRVTGTPSYGLVSYGRRLQGWIRTYPAPPASVRDTPCRAQVQPWHGPTRRAGPKSSHGMARDMEEQPATPIPPWYAWIHPDGAGPARAEAGGSRPRPLAGGDSRARAAGRDSRGRGGLGVRTCAGPRKDPDASSRLYSQTVLRAFLNRGRDLGGLRVGTVLGAGFRVQHLAVRAGKRRRGELRV